MDSADPGCIHTHTPKHTRGEKLSQHTFFERQNVPKRVRDEKEVREAKAESPRERLRVRRKDTVKRQRHRKSAREGREREMEGEEGGRKRTIEFWRG